MCMYTEATQFFYQAAAIASGTPKLAETGQRQGQPNWNKLCGKGCPTSTKHRSPNDRNLPTDLPGLIRIYYAAMHMDVLRPGTDQRTGVCPEVYSLQRTLSFCLRRAGKWARVPHN